MSLHCGRWILYPDHEGSPTYILNAPKMKPEVGKKSASTSSPSLQHLQIWHQVVKGFCSLTQKAMGNWNFPRLFFSFLPFNIIKRGLCEGTKALSKDRNKTMSKLGKTFFYFAGIEAGFFTWRIRIFFTMFVGLLCNRWISFCYVPTLLSLPPTPGPIPPLGNYSRVQSFVLVVKMWCQSLFATHWL